MKNTIVALVSFITVIVSLAKLCDYWISEESKKKLADKFAELWIKIEDSDFSIFAKIPLNILEYIYEAILGDETFSKKAFLRTSLISILLLFASLSINGIRANTPLGFSTYPWQIIEKQRNYADLMINTHQKQMEETKDEDARKALLKMHDLLYDFRHIITGISNQYAVFFIIVLAITNACFFSASFAVSRLLLKEIMNNDSYIVRLSILFLAAVYAIILGSFVIAILSVIYSPIIITIAVPLLSVSWILTLAIAVPFIIGLWLIGWTWLKVTASMILFPTTMLCVALLLSIILYPFRGELRSLIGTLLLKASQVSNITLIPPLQNHLNSPLLPKWT